MALHNAITTIMATRSKQQTDRFFDHLFSTKENIEETGAESISDFFLLEREKIEVQAQPRTQFAPDSLKELAESIRELQVQGRGIGGTGILQPLLVRSVSGAKGTSSYVLVAGERRLRASATVGVNKLPVIVVGNGGISTLAEQLVENLQRQDLSVLEEAQGISRLIEIQQISAREAGRLLGKDRGWVNNRLALLRANEDVRSLVESGNATLSHALLIESAKEPELRSQLLEATRAGEPIAKLRSLIDSSENGGDAQQDDGVALHNATPSAPKAEASRFDFSTVERALKKLTQEIKKSEKTEDERDEIRSQISRIRATLKKLEASL